MCIDLYLCFRNPFYPKGKRTKWYYIGSVLLVMILSRVSHEWVGDQKETFDEYELPLIFDEPEVLKSIE